MKLRDYLVKNTDFVMIILYIILIIYIVILILKQKDNISILNNYNENFTAHSNKSKSASKLASKLAPTTASKYLIGAPAES